jgi:hypothetical protein
MKGDLFWGWLLETRPEGPRAQLKAGAFTWKLQATKECWDRSDGQSRIVLVESEGLMPRQEERGA